MVQQGGGKHSSKYSKKPSILSDFITRIECARRFEGRKRNNKILLSMGLCPCLNRLGPKWRIKKAITFPTLWVSRASYLNSKIRNVSTYFWRFLWGWDLGCLGKLVGNLPKPIKNNHVSFIIKITFIILFYNFSKFTPFQIYDILQFKPSN